MVRDKEAAEDLVQEVFLKFWNRAESLPENLNAKAYLYKSVRNSSLNHLDLTRKNLPLDAQMGEKMENSLSSDSGLLAGEVETSIHRALEELPPACRHVFLLSRNEELSYKEIAETLDVSIKTVEAQMSKALKVLRAHLLPFLLMVVSLSIFFFKNA